MLAKVRWMVCGMLLMGYLLTAPGDAYAADCLTAVDAPGCAYGLPAEQYQALLPLMLANPAPAVRPLDVDTATVKQYSTPTQRASSFTGVLLHAMPYPMAWIITSNRPSTVPGQLPSKSTPVLPRYSRVYIFASLRANGWKWYLVGPGQWVQQTNIAILAMPTKPDGLAGRWVAVDVWQQTLIAYDADQPVFATLVSSGKPSHPTRQGIHAVWLRLPTDDMNGDMGAPDAYSLPYVPFVMYFDHSISLHGTYWHDNFGYAQSHGCVNLSITDAHWLFDWTQSAPNMPVYVWSSR